MSIAVVVTSVFRQVNVVLYVGVILPGQFRQCFCLIVVLRFAVLLLWPASGRIRLWSACSALLRLWPAYLTYFACGQRTWLISPVASVLDLSRHSLGLGHVCLLSSCYTAAAYLRSLQCVSFEKTTCYGVRASCTAGQSPKGIASTSPFRKAAWRE